MLEAADAGMPILQLAGVFLGEIEQILHRIRRQRGVYHQHVRAGPEHCNGGERFNWIIGQLIEPGVDGMR